jgi:hypothetical protein
VVPRLIAGSAGLLGLLAALAVVGDAGRADAVAPGAVPIKSRNIAVSREGANKAPRSEGDQALLEGWPLYRSERGQTAFNDAMATLSATEGPAPAPAAFRACARLDCPLSLPAMGAGGWLPSGRLWVSPRDYVLIVHSPRPGGRLGQRRRGSAGMRVLVLHEFHNSTRNTDVFDTISAHRGAVFVPFYMGKPARDARGRSFVVVVQVAPYDVLSIHATNHGSAGPGIEVAKSANEPLEPLQAEAGVVVAAMITAAAPQLRVVNHRGSEGRPMLEAYERRLATLRARPGAPAVTLPFVPAAAERLAVATGRLQEIVARPDASPPLAIAERGIVPPAMAAAASLPPPVLVEPIRLATRPVAPAPVLVEPVRPAQRPGNAGG